MSGRLSIRCSDLSHCVAGGRAIGVVLTGTLGDGAAGLMALKQCGGVTVVQDPSDAAFPEMPATALSKSKPDHIVALSEMPALFEKLVQQPAGAFLPVPASLKYEVEVARSGHTSMSTMDRIGRRSVLACPDCHGIMWEIDEDDLVRYRCHVGHTYTAELLSIALNENLRRALASALRALEERVALAQRLHEQENNGGRTRLAEFWAQKRRELEQEANVIREAMRRVDEITAHASHDYAQGSAAAAD